VVCNKWLEHSGPNIHKPLAEWFKIGCNIDYSDDSINESVFTVESASKWKEDTTRYMKIKVVDVHSMFSDIDLSCEAELLVIPHPITDRMLDKRRMDEERRHKKFKIR
jgi:hypothetical protein